jgi:hypothetical protein
MLALMSSVQAAQQIVEPFDSVPFLKQSFFTGEEKTPHELEGQFHFLDRQYTATLEFIPNESSIISVLKLDSFEMEDLHLLNKNLPTGPLSRLGIQEMDNIHVTISSGDVAGEAIRKGIAITGEITLEHPLFQKIVAVSNCDSQALYAVSLYIPIDPSQAELEITVPTQHQLTPLLTLCSFVFTLKGLPPSLGVSTFVRFAPPSGAPLMLAASGSVNLMSELRLAGSLEGEWTHALGIENLRVEKLGLGFAANVNPLLPPYVFPLGLSLAGSMCLGTRDVELVAHIDKQKCGFRGSIDRVALSDLVSYAAQLSHQHVNEERVPRIELKNFLVSIAPERFSIAGLKFDAGIGVQGQLYLFRNCLDLNFHVSEAGLYSIQNISPLALGILLVKGLHRNNEGSQGPVLKISLEDSNLEMSLKGWLEARPFINAESTIQFDRDTMSFDCINEITLSRDHVAHYRITGSAPMDFESPNFVVKINFLETFKDFLKIFLGRTLEQRGFLFDIDILDISFEGSLDELSYGVIPRLRIEVNIGDRILRLPEIAFDIERPHISLKTIAHTIISELRDIF